MTGVYETGRLRELPIEQVAESLGMSVRGHKTLCPFHKDRHPSLMFDVRRNRYRCFACGAHGNVIDLVSECRGLGFRDSCEWLSRRYGICNGSVVAKHVTPPAPDLDYLEKLVQYPVLSPEASRFLFDERRIRPEVVAWLGISSITHDCPMGWSRKAGHFDGPALLIPYRDRNGRLQSVQSRYLGAGDRPRFRFPSGSSCHIFGLQVLMFLGKGEPLFITEGVTDCMAVMSSGHKAVAIPSATLLNSDDLMHLRGLNLHIFPDNDAPGERLYSQLCDALADIGTNLTRHIVPGTFKDFGEWWSLRQKQTDKK